MSVLLESACFLQKATEIILTYEHQNKGVNSPLVDYYHLRAPMSKGDLMLPLTRTDIGLVLLYEKQVTSYLAMLTNTSAVLSITALGILTCPHQWRMCYASFKDLM